MTRNTIICCVLVVTINDYLYLYVNQLYYARVLILMVLYLLFDIFRIYHDYLLVSKELEILRSHDKYMLEEIRYNAILLKDIQCSMETLKANNKIILLYCKKFNNYLIK
jgi:hypothetical protein